MKKPLLVALLMLAAARPAWPCGGDYDYTPRSRLVLHSEESGLQPWISTSNADPKNVTLFAVTKQCAEGERCEGDVIGFELAGDYIRPSKPLPEGTRLQVMFGSKLIGDYTLQASPKALKEWKGLTVGAVSYDPVQGMTAVTISPPADQDLAETLMFVYWSRPDPANPLKNLAEVREGASGGDIRTYKRPKVGMPVQLWIVVADADGHLIAPQKIL